MSLSVKQTTTINLEEIVKTLTIAHFEILDEDTVVIVLYEDDDDSSDLLMSFNIKTKQKGATLKLDCVIAGLSVVKTGPKLMLVSSRRWVIVRIIFDGLLCKFF